MKNLHPKFKSGALGATLGVVVITGLKLFSVDLTAYEAGIVVGLCNQIGVWSGADKKPE